MKKIVGFFAGLVCGLFSSGGGMILVPALIHIFKIEDKKARATSVFIVLPIVIITAIVYQKNNLIDLKLALKCAIGGIIGGIIGAKALKIIPKQKLQIIFILLLIYSSYKLITS